MEEPGARDEIVARAAKQSEQHAELGLTDMFMACRMLPTAPRVSRPAIGFGQDATRLGKMATTLARIGEETRKRGATSCLRPHVGTWIETRQELDRLMERLDPDVVALGPDTGHLAWAEVDPIDVVRTYGRRVKAAHIKDVRLDVARRNRVNGCSHKQVVMQDLRAEPGRVDLDLDGFVAALEPSFRDWLVVEVERPSLLAPEASVEASARWAKKFGD
jgi:inosose dehydratase